MRFFPSKPLFPASFLIFLLFAALPALAAPGDVLYESNFRGGLGGIAPFSGAWETEGDILRQTTADWDVGAALPVKLPPGKPFALEITARPLDAFFGAGVLFSMQDPRAKNRSQMVRFDTSMGVMWGWFDEKGDYQFQGSAEGRLFVGDGKPHTLKVVVDPALGKYHIYVDGRRVQENLDLEFTQGALGIDSAGGPHAYIRARVTEPTAAERAGLSRLPYLNQPRGIAVSANGRVFVTQRGPNTVQVLGPNGAPVRAFAPQGERLDQVADPGALRIAGNHVYVLDRKKWRVQIYTLSGGHRATLPLPAETRDIAVTADETVFALGADGVVTVFSAEGGGTFSGTGTEPGQTIAASGIAVDAQGRVYLADNNEKDHKYKIEVWQWDKSSRKATHVRTIPAWLQPRRLAVAPGGNIATLGALGFYEPFGAIRLLRPDGRPITHTGLFSLGAMGKEGALAYGPDGRLYLAETARNRVVVLPGDLAEPDPVARVTPGAATITWDAPKTQAGALATLRWAETAEPQAWRTARVTRTPGGRLQATLTGLEPSRRYYYQFQPAPRVFSADPAARWSKTYDLLAAAPAGKMNFIRAKILTAIYLRSDLGGKEVVLPREKLGDKIPREFQQAREFYWRNSRFSFDLDFADYIVLDQVAELDGTWLDPARVWRDIEPELARRGRKRSDYTSLIAVWAQPHYDAATPTPFGAVAGGGLTPYGYSTFGIGDTLPWLVVHEYNHQVDNFFEKGGQVKFWLNHPDPTVHPGRYGGQYDVNAFIFRQWRPDEWRQFKQGAVVETDDANGNGIPDDDPSLILDEVRLGGDPATPARPHDMAKALRGIFTSDSLRGRETPHTSPYRDTGGPWPPRDAVLSLRRGTPPGDGPFDAARWSRLHGTRGKYIHADVYANWDDAYLYLAAAADRPFRLEVDIDADNDGWFHGADNTEIRVEARDPAKPATLTARTAALYAGTNTPLEGVRMRAERIGDRHVVRLAIPADRARGLTYVRGKTLGLLVFLRTDANAGPMQGFGSLFEPWVNQQVRLEE